MCHSSWWWRPSSADAAAVRDEPFDGSARGVAEHAGGVLDERDGVECGDVGAYATVPGSFGSQACGLVPLDADNAAASERGQPFVPAAGAGEQVDYQRSAQRAFLHAHPRYRHSSIPFVVRETAPEPGNTSTTSSSVGT